MNEDRWDLDSAYSDGYEDAQGRFVSDNPYDAEKERALYDEYEKGFAEGKQLC